MKQLGFRYNIVILVTAFFISAQSEPATSQSTAPRAWPPPYMEKLPADYLVRLSKTLAVVNERAGEQLENEQPVVWVATATCSFALGENVELLNQYFASDAFEIGAALSDRVGFRLSSTTHIRFYALYNSHTGVAKGILSPAGERKFEQYLWDCTAPLVPLADANRTPYHSASRRALMIHSKEEPGVIVFDENGDGYFRRDVFFTPDYTLSTMTIDPSRDYNVVGNLAQLMGATFAADVKSRIVVTGTGYYARCAISGITGNAASIIARDPNAELGLDRFKSNGTRVFISNGLLWDNRIEDASGWFFTRAGDAYAAIRVADGGYQITQRTYVWPDRKLQEVEERHGRHLELNDMWAPIVIQMGRSSDYNNFEAFQSSVKENRFGYQDGKITYTSEAGETFQYWAKGAQQPKINEETVNLNPAKTFDSPFLSMEHGSNKAVISYPGYSDVVLEF